MVDPMAPMAPEQVGWGIPPELFGPYTSGAVESVRSMWPDGMSRADSAGWEHLASGQLYRTMENHHFEWVNQHI